MNTDDKHVQADILTDKLEDEGFDVEHSSHYLEVDLSDLIED